jgi:transcriptional regulator with XRE-family HTH domain
MMAKLEKRGDEVIKRLIIGPALRERREEMGISQAQAAKALGYKYGNFIGMIETGYGRFPIDKWKEYANYFGFPKHEFLKLVLSELYPDMIPYLDFHEPAASQKKRKVRKTGTEDA